MADGPCHGILARCRAALASDAGCTAPAWEQCTGIQRSCRTTRALLRVRAGYGRPRPRAARQLRPGADHPPARNRRRRGQAPLRHLRPARRARPWHRRNEERQRDRRGAGRRPSLLLRRLRARSRPGPDDRGRLPRRGALRRDRNGAPSAGAGQARPDRQLSGRMAGHDDGRDPSRSAGPNPPGRLAALLLGRHPGPAAPCAISAACSAAPG